MPPPSAAAAAVTATRLASQWVVDALAADESLDFSLLKALVAASPEILTGAPVATRERVALRCLQEVSSVASGSGGDAAATAGVLRVEAARSCEDVLLELVRELKEVDTEIASVYPPSQLEQNGTNLHTSDQSLHSSHDDVNKDNAEFQQETSANLVDETESRNVKENLISPAFVPHQSCTSGNTSYDHLQENAATVGLGTKPPDKIPAADENVPVGALHVSAGCDATLQGSTTEPLSKDTEVNAALVQPQSPREQFPNAPPHCIDAERLHDDGARDQSLKHSHKGLDPHAAAAPTVDRSSDALPTNPTEPPDRGPLPESVTPDDTTMISQPHSSNIDRNILLSAALILSKEVNLKLTICQGMLPSIILEKNTVHGGLNVQAASLSQKYNLTLHDKDSEANCSYEQNTGKSRIDVQKNSCHPSVPNITQNGTATNTTSTSNKSNLGDASAGIPYVSSSYDNPNAVAAAGLLSMTNKFPSWNKDQEVSDSLEGMPQQDLCIKCGKASQLLKCSGCLLAAHDSCFGSSMAFQESDLFYCPVCFYTKATEAYQKARKTYLEARKNLATFLGTTQVAGQQDELLTEVLPRVPNREGQSNMSDSSKRKNVHQHEAVNLTHRDEESDEQRKKQKINTTRNDYPKEIVTEKASSVQVQDAEQQQQGENKEAGSRNSSHETRRSSQKRCHPPVHQEVDTDKEDCPAKSNESNDSDEIEASSSNDSGKRSSPPWRKIRHNKSRLQGKETVASPSRKRNYTTHRRYTNPVAPTGRRTKLSWTEEEETTLKEAMEKFAPRDDGPIPWVQILEYGRDVFHRTRLPSDLRVKWRNIMKKAGS